MTNDELKREIIGQAIGEASMCWIPTPTGVFDSTTASKIVDRTIEHLTPHNPPAETWQTIDSAPRDGSWILGYWPTMSITQFPKAIFADDCSKHDIWHMADNIEYGCVYPTHWMPLPAAPKPINKGE